MVLSLLDGLQVPRQVRECSASEVLAVEEEEVMLLAREPKYYILITAYPGIVTTIVFWASHALRPSYHS